MTLTDRIKLQITANRPKVVRLPAKDVLKLIERADMDKLAADAWRKGAPMSWQPEDANDLGYVIWQLEHQLPGWWWSVGACSVSADASIGPDRNGPDAHLLKDKQFDDGFHVDLPQPATCADALRHVMRQALRSKSNVQD